MHDTRREKRSLDVDEKTGVWCAALPTPVNAARAPPKSDFGAAVEGAVINDVGGDKRAKLRATRAPKVPKMKKWVGGNGKLSWLRR